MLILAAKSRPCDGAIDRHCLTVHDEVAFPETEKIANVSVY